MGILIITIANTCRINRTTDQQPTSHERIITSTSQETNLPSQDNNTPPQGMLHSSQGPNLRGVDPLPQEGNPSQGNNVPMIQTTESSLPLTNPLAGMIETPIPSIQATLATLL